MLDYNKIFSLEPFALNKKQKKNWFFFKQKKLSNYHYMNDFKNKIFVLKNTLDPELESKLLGLNIQLPEKISDTRFFFYSNILISKGINLYIELFENNHNLKKGFSITNLGRYFLRCLKLAWELQIPLRHVYSTWNTDVMCSKGFWSFTLIGADHLWH